MHIPTIEEDRERRFNLMLGELKAWYQVSNEGQRKLLMNSISEMADIISEEMPELEED